MSRLVAQFDPSTAARGEFATQAPNRCSWLYVMNESPNFIQLDLGSNGQPLVQPWRNRLFSLPTAIQTVAWSVVATLQSGSAPASMVYVEMFNPNETPSASLDSAVFRQSNVGNTVATSNIGSLKNDGNPPATQIIEATPLDQSASSIALDNDGSGFIRVLSANLLRSLLNVVRGNTGAGKAAFTLGDSGDTSITTLYGVIGAGSVVPAATVAPGTLPAGVDLTTISSDGGAFVTDGAGNLTLNGYINVGPSGSRLNLGVDATGHFVNLWTPTPASTAYSIDFHPWTGSANNATLHLDGATGHVVIYTSAWVNGNRIPVLASAGGGAAGVTNWEGTTDPGALAAEGDTWDPA